MSETNTGAPASPSASAAPSAEAQEASKLQGQPASAEKTQSAKSGTNVDKAVQEVFGDKAASETDEVVEDDASDLEEAAKLAKKEVEKLKRKLKVGNKEIEVDEDELIKRAQMGYSAQEKWEEAAKMRKQLDNFLGLLQKDPATALEKMGFNVDELAEKRIQQRIEEMKKSPEQLELEKLRRERDEIMAEREKEREIQRQAEIQRYQDQYAVQLEQEIAQAFEQVGNGLPKSPYMLKRISDVLIWGMQNKKEITPSKALEIVQKEVKEELRQMYEATPDEMFEALVGKDRLNKYRRAKASSRKVTRVSDVKPTGQTEMAKAKVDAEPPKKIRDRDFFRNLGRK